MTTYTRSFYFHTFLVITNGIFIVLILSYLTIPDTEFEELDTEICIKREPITNYCLETEKSEAFDRIDDTVIYFILVLNLAFLFMNLYKIKEEYKKANPSRRNN